MAKFKISIVDVNEHLYVIKAEGKDVDEAKQSIIESKKFIDVGSNKSLNPKHIVTIRGDKLDA
jgi:hypothetical protein